MIGERLQKVLAQQGVGSRRGVEVMIKEGRVKVNGKVAELGVRVTPACKIVVDKKLITLKSQQHTSIIYHKPEGEVCTRKPEPGQVSIYSKLPKLETGRWLSVGRLDLNTSGLLLLTTDGEKLQQLQHPRFNLEREYKVRAYGHFDTSMMRKLQSAMQLEDGKAKFLSIKHDTSKGSNHWFSVTLGEGRNRLVRRMFTHVGLEVNRLIRIRFGDNILPHQLRPGQYRSITL
jgi:23S rRNA pseudouridine2605 synthase